MPKRFAHPVWYAFGTLRVSRVIGGQAACDEATLPPHKHPLLSARRVLNVGTIASRGAVGLYIPDISSKRNRLSYKPVWAGQCYVRGCSRDV